MAYPSEDAGKLVALLLPALELLALPVVLPVELVRMLLAVCELHLLQLQQLDDLEVALLDVVH